MAVIDAVFFDVDGTLVDAREDIANAMNFTLRKLDIEERPEELIVSYIGTGVKDLARKCLGPDNKGLTDKAVEIFSRYYIRHSTDNSRLYPHVKEILILLKGKSNYIVTNRYAEFADTTLKGLGVRDYFKDIIGGDDEKCLKPSPCVLDRFFQKTKVDKSRSIIVGDMAIDILTGKNAGILTCWVTYGLGKDDDVRPLKPDYIIDDLIELKDIIE